MEVNKTYNEPCLETLKRMPNNFIDCVITSPPYWQLRDYGYDGQWGLEPTFQEYLENLWSLMDEIYRVLKPTGTAWINLGDTYGGSKKGNDDKKHNGEVGNRVEKNGGVNKSLILIPHRFAIGCIDRGWIVRNDIIWAKRNGMPESVTDRFSKKHEYFFLMAKSEKYFFDLDAIRDKHKWGNDKRNDGNRHEYTEGVKSMNNKWLATNAVSFSEGGKNPGTVSDFWDIPTKPSSDSHYAMYNDELLKKPVLSGCPEFICNKCGLPREKIIENTPMVINRSNRREEMGQPNGTASSGTMVSPAINKVIGMTDCGCNEGFSGGIIYDPFMGSGTTGKMALRTNRRFIGSEMGENYSKLADKGLNAQLSQTKLF